MACTGTDYCTLAQIETKTQAVQLSQALEQRLGTGLKAISIHWSGCPAGCGNHQAADIGIRGLRANINGEIVDAVAIYAGGRTGPDAVVGEQVMGVVPINDELPDLVASVIQHRGLVQLRPLPPNIPPRCIQQPTPPQSAPSRTGP